MAVTAKNVTVLTGFFSFGRGVGVYTIADIVTTPSRELRSQEMFKRTVIAASLAMLPGAAVPAETIYVWFDSSGVKHFSEICPAGVKCREREVSKKRANKLLYGSPDATSDGSTTDTGGGSSATDTSASSTTTGGATGSTSGGTSGSSTSSSGGDTTTASDTTSGTPTPAASPSGYVTGGGIYTPPTSGSFAYNAFKPGAAGFPVVGATYTDPVFGGNVLRLSDRKSAGDDDMYAHHWANANGTYAFQTSGGEGRVISTSTGAVLRSGSSVPRGSVGFEMAWDANDPNAYYFYSGSSLMLRNLQTETSTAVYTFPGTLQSNGGSLNAQSADGRYFTVRYGGTNKLWDSQSKVIYTGAVKPLSSTGWVSITPDGNFLVTAAGPTSTPQREHYSYAINHGAKSIASTPTQFWGLCGDHGVLVSASDGRNYFVTFACHANNPGLYRVDITLNQVGKTEQQQQAANRLLVPLGWRDVDGHLSAVSKGPLRDWVFYSSETADDNYNGSTSGWAAYRQEIMAINVLTGEVRRLAHHRSRGLGDGSYWNQPRVSSSWDGSVVLWNSNFNASSPKGYADMYGILNPLGTAR
jgi:hypothetical protein